MIYTSQTYTTVNSIQCTAIKLEPSEDLHEPVVFCDRNQMTERDADSKT